MRESGPYGGLKALRRRLADILAPTWRGLLLLAIAGLTLWYLGFEKLDLVVFAIAILTVSVVLLCSLGVTLTALWLRRRLNAAGVGSRLEAGVPLTTGFRAPAMGRLPLIRLRWEWREPDNVEVRPKEREGELREEVVIGQRCQVARLSRRFLVEDVLGLAQVAWERTDPAPFSVLPNRGGLRAMPPLFAVAGGEVIPHPTAGTPEGDRMEIRPYQPGDSVRNIMWKTYARTRELKVRLPERSLDRARKTIAYLVTGPGDEPAAAAARVTLEKGDLGDEWLFGADGTVDPVDALEPALEAIARSGSLGEDRPTNGLLGFLESASGGGVHCVVFAPARPGPWTQEAMEAARAYPGLISFVLGTDGIARREPRALWHRLLFAEPNDAGTPSEELAGLLRTLASAGSSTLVVDRETGRTYSEAHQQALGAAA